jgi:DNA-binding transcriptional regulator/RsmH inhibitor MraZ
MKILTLKMFRNGSSNVVVIPKKLLRFQKVKNHCIIIGLLEDYEVEKLERSYDDNRLLG